MEIGVLPNGPGLLEFVGHALTRTSPQQDSFGLRDALKGSVGLRRESQCRSGSISDTENSTGGHHAAFAGRQYRRFARCGGRSLFHFGNLRGHLRTDALNEELQDESFEESCTFACEIGFSRPDLRGAAIGLSVEQLSIPELRGGVGFLCDCAVGVVLHLVESLADEIVRIRCLGGRRRLEVIDEQLRDSHRIRVRTFEEVCDRNWIAVNRGLAVVVVLRIGLKLLERGG